MIATKPLDATDKRIVKELMEGLTVTKTAEKLRMNKRTVEARCNRMREKYSCQTIAQLLIELLKHHSITTNQ